MEPLTEKNAETLIQEHLGEQGWDLTNFSLLTKGYRDNLGGKEADYAFLLEGKAVAFMEAKKPRKDLFSALDQAKDYARRHKDNGGNEIALVFASDGKNFLRQNLQANTLPEKIEKFPTPAEFKEFFNPQTTSFLGTLWDYQRVAVSQILGAIQSGRTKMYLQMATASGKTIVAAGAISKLWSVGLVQRTLFLVDRDALASQTERKLKYHLGDNLSVRRATGERKDKFADVLITTVQYLATRKKYLTFTSDSFNLVILDECHRSYFGDWHPVLEHFYSGGARLLGMTATPSDKETVNTDHYFTDKGQFKGPIFRYTIRQGEKEGILAQCHHFKFHTNVDLYGVHDMGFDFEPDQLGRAVDVPERNRLIAEKYFEILGTREPVKTIVFAASIQHAKNLRYALIQRYNELNNLPPNDAAAEKFIVAIHNEMPNARELIEKFQQITPSDEMKRIIKKAHKDKYFQVEPIVAVGIGMLDTGIDAPDIEILLMARPTKSKILYVQMKGRGTRKCSETDKEYYKLVDFVDITRMEELVTNETPGVVDVDEQEDEEELKKHIESEGEDIGEKERPDREPQQMVILDVPVTLESSEVFAPAVLENLKRQIEKQLQHVVGHEALKERFGQTIMCWRYFKGEAPIDHTFLSTMGFDLHTLRDLYGETEATLEDFVSVAKGEADFGLLHQRRELEKWAQSKGLSKDKREFVLMLCDFMRANPEITPEQILRSQWLNYHGGLSKIKNLFGSFQALFDLSKEAMSITRGSEEVENAKNS